MSDFNRNVDPAYRPVDPTISHPYAADALARRPVVVEQRSSGFGPIIGAILLAAIAVGGYYAYNHSASFRTASNSTTTASPTAIPTPPASVPDNTAGQATSPSNR